MHVQKRCLMSLATFLEPEFFSLKQRLKIPKEAHVQCACPYTWRKIGQQQLHPSLLDTKPAKFLYWKFKDIPQLCPGGGRSGAFEPVRQHLSETVIDHKMLGTL